MIILKWFSLRKKEFFLVKCKLRSMFVDYNVERKLKVDLSLIFYCKEGNFGLGIIEVRLY